MAEAAVHIHWTRTHAARKIRRRCPTCEKRTTFYCFFQEWYGWMVTCIACGERWEDGERLPRPFAPGWRKDNIRSARRRWQRFQAGHARGGS